MGDFQQKARAASTSFSSMNPAEALGQTLINDKPTIDSAIKSYLSIFAARSWSATDPIVNARVGLICARSLSKKINSYRIPIPDSATGVEGEEKDEEKILEISVVRILWNGLIDKGKKPSMLLGRKSLIYTFPSILEELKQQVPNGVDSDVWMPFIEDFGRLLVDATNRVQVAKGQVDIENDDSCLLWDTDGGEAELKRRRNKRKMQKMVNVRKQDDPLTTIEEILED